MTYKKVAEYFTDGEGRIVGVELVADGYKGKLDCGFSITITNLTGCKLFLNGQEIPEKGKCEIVAHDEAEKKLLKRSFAYIAEELKHFAI